MKLLDDEGRERDFHFEMQKHSAHLRGEFLARQLAIYELYKLVINIPGSVMEFGVRNGANFFYLARLIEIFNAAARYDGISSRHLIGFDTFEGFPSIDQKDQSVASWGDMKVGGVPTNRTAFFEDLEKYKLESSLVNRIHVVEGDVVETLPAYLSENTGIRVALAYFDVDLYQPTLAALNAIWDLVPTGGVLVFDEYALPEFPGETVAVDEFLRDKEMALTSIPWCYSPSAFVVKGGKSGDNTWP